LAAQQAANVRLRVRRQVGRPSKAGDGKLRTQNIVSIDRSYIATPDWPISLENPGISDTRLGIRSLAVAARPRGRISPLRRFL